MKLYLQISNQTGVPAYRQIMEQVSEYRQSGVLKQGEKLPSIRQLAKQLAVNPGTIVKAYQELEHDGVIYSEHGRGVFVAEMLSVPMSRSKREQAVRVIAEQLWLQAERMNLTEEEVVRICEEEINKLRNR